MSTLKRITDEDEGFVIEGFIFYNSKKLKMQIVLLIDTLPKYRI